jgi:RHS repeat-associated protein
VRGGTTLQNLLYTYDAVGNIVALRDMLRTAQETAPFFSGTLVESGDGFYVYDAIYRLLSATGREHPGLQPIDTDAAPFGSIPHRNDLQALKRYVERYKYDEVGNIKEVAHRPEVGTTGGWTRTYQYEANSNRLRFTSVPGDEQNVTLPYGHDEHGSMTSMPHLAQMDWDYADRLQHTLRANGGGPQNTYFTYDGSGERVRKVFVHLGLIKERIYLGGYEIYRERSSTPGAANTFERQTLHVVADQRRVAMVETKTIEQGGQVPDTRWRLQLDNHMGSAMIELNAGGNVITYEEYHPYGSTAFHAATGEVSTKRYRYTGKERDEETGLYYHGARYYAPWIGRWTAVDPEGTTDGLNLYRYSRGNPIRFSDPAGTQSRDWEIYQRFFVAPPRPPTPEERFRRIFFEENIKDPTKAHAQTLIHAFTDPGIPGQSVTERFKAILALTGNDPYLHFNATIGATGTGRGPKAVGDTGFRPEFRDSALHRESSNQIGHFLTAADIGYANEGRTQRIEADEKLRQEHPIVWGMSHQDQGAVSPEVIDAAINETLVRAIIGHERYGDTQSAFETSYGAITSADVTDVKNFEAGRLDLIAVDPTKAGASRQDLLLSFVGYKFGTRVAQGMFASKEEAQRWLTTMLTDTKLESIKKEDPFFADAQQLLGILNKFQQQQQRRQQPQPQPQK